MKIRQSTLQDFPAIKALTDDLLKDTQLGLADDRKLAALIIGKRSTLLVAELEGEMVGFICGVVFESPFNNIIRASDLGLYIKPGTRSAVVGKRLVEAYEEWARDLGATQCWLGQSTGNRIEETADYYRRLGYKVVGYNSIKEL
jgi:GNAT superfamily N-acetyltransferase